MRLWSLHPAHLDARGLVALWREGLLARAVLRGQTLGYRHHPQLDRFRAHATPVAAINAYLAAVLQESQRRGYRFDAGKLRGPRTRSRMRVTRGQLAFEWKHLRAKLKQRAPEMFQAVRKAKPKAHPSFRVIAGGIEPWEVRREV